MRGAIIAALLLAVAVLYLTPSTTPYSPYNPGPNGLSELAQICRTSANADVVILAPGASLPNLNVSASTAEIVDPLINFGSPYIPAAADVNGTALAAPNATPLIGNGEVLIATSPTSFAGTARGPYPLALAVREGNRTVYIYHASLFTNLAMRWNSAYAERICARPVEIVVAGGDPSHWVHEYLYAARPWIAPAALAAMFLYLALKARRGRV
ncbi:MAG: hypothetical protein RXQ56_10240 [Thermoproteus sp.]